MIWDTWNIPIEEVKVVVFSYPNHMISAELSIWLGERFYAQPSPLPDSIVYSSIQGELTCVRNEVIMREVIRSDNRFKWFLFADNDVRPDAHADEIFRLNTDVRAVRSQHDNPRCWASCETWKAIPNSLFFRSIQN